jgi:putative spermidine/putrescine transport system permease protein
VRLALLVTILALTLGTTAAMGLTRYRFPGRDLLNTFLMSPLIFPSIITGIALLQFCSMLGLSSAFFTLTVGHTIITLPYVVRNVIASLQSVRGNFEEAARVLGASAWQAFIRVTLPLKIFFMVENVMNPSVAAASASMIFLSALLIIITEKVVGLRRAMSV